MKVEIIQDISDFDLVVGNEAKIVVIDAALVVGATGPPGPPGPAGGLGGTGGTVTAGSGIVIVGTEIRLSIGTLPQME
jgi:hypothetical protein